MLGELHGPDVVVVVSSFEGFDAVGKGRAARGGGCCQGWSLLGKTLPF